MRRDRDGRSLEDGFTRRIPLICKVYGEDPETPLYKERAIKRLIKLYGRENILGMVGDTPETDGYAARASEIPFYNIGLDEEGEAGIEGTVHVRDWRELKIILSPRLRKKTGGS